MTSNTSSNRGKQLFNLLMTLGSVMVLGVIAAAIYAGTKDMTDTQSATSLPSPGSTPLSQSNQHAAAVDSKLPASVLKTGNTQPKSNTLSAGQAGTLNPGSQLKKSYRIHRIAMKCNGVPSAGANFRRYPTLDANSILGIVDAGQMIWVTGQTIKSDGVIWHEVITLLLLAPASQTKLNANQVGWIADCFLAH